MVRKTLPPQQRQSEIMDAAIELFQTQGIESTSVSDIVKRAGVAQGTFYWYFKSKDEIINKIVQVLAERILKDMIQLIDSPERAALEKIAGIKDLLQNLISHKNTLARFHRENNHFHDQLSKEVVRLLTPAIARLIIQGQKEGVFVVDYPDRAAAFALAACLGIPQDSTIFTADNQVESWLNSLFEFILRGLGCAIN